MDDEERKAVAREYQRQRYQNDPEHRERVKQRARKWQKENRARRRDRLREQYHQRRATWSPERLAAYLAKRAAHVRAWQAKNKEHQAAYSKTRREGRMELYDRVKRERGCCRCGENDPRCLDFHHRDRSKKEFTMAQARHRTLDVILAEMAKCDVICANCHRKEHDGNRRLHLEKSA